MIETIADKVLKAMREAGDRILRIEEAAKITGCGEWEIRHAIKRGRRPADLYGLVQIASAPHSTLLLPTPRLVEQWTGSPPNLDS